MGMGSACVWVYAGRKNGNRIHPSQPCKAAVGSITTGESESSRVQEVGRLLAPSFSLERA